MAAKHKRDEALTKLKAASRRQEVRISHLEREVEALRAALMRLMPAPADDTVDQTNAVRPDGDASEAGGPGAPDAEQQAAPSTEGPLHAGLQRRQGQAAAPSTEDPFADAETAIRELQRSLSRHDASAPERDGSPPGVPEAGPLEAPLLTQQDPAPRAEREATEVLPLAVETQRDQTADKIEDERPAPDDGRPAPAQAPRPWWRIL